MAESSDPVLFTRRAQRGTGAAAVDGVCMVSRSRVRWQPNDPSKGQPATLDVAAITREQAHMKQDCVPCCAVEESSTDQPAHHLPLLAGWRAQRTPLCLVPPWLCSACGGTQQAPGKPFIKLDAASGALVLGFESVADRDEAVDLLKQLKPPAAAPQQVRVRCKASCSSSSGGGGSGDHALVDLLCAR